MPRLELPHQRDDRAAVRWIGVVVLLVLLSGLLVWALWNALLPDLFGFKGIGYWQAVGLCLLVRALSLGIVRMRG